jgi:hypothetical protein
MTASDHTVPLREVLDDLNVELGSCYTLKARGAWPWLFRRGRLLHVDLLAAAQFWGSAGKRTVALRLLQRAADLQRHQQAHGELLRELREGVGR